MQASDLKQVLQIQTVCNLGRWRKTDFEKEMLNSSAILKIAAQNEKIVGFVSARLITPLIEILNIGVSPEVRREGIGKILLQDVLEQSEQRGASESWLEVRASNQSALNFYHSHGYQIVGRRPNYYSDPNEDAVLMTFTFSDGNPKK